MVGAQTGHTNLLLDETDQAGRVRELVIAQRDQCTLGPRIELFDIGDPTPLFDGNHIQKVFDFFGQLTKPVDHLGSKLIDFFTGSQFRDTAVKTKAHTKIGHISIRNQNWHADIDLRDEACFF